MREVLDNARYMPTVGRFKVYLIDEVHMLSKAAFNSMLRRQAARASLVLATPIRRSRSPSAALPSAQPDKLAGVDRRVLTRSSPRKRVTHDGPARADARAAHGSVRDALSLLDQAIAWRRQRPEDVVRTMRARSTPSTYDRDALVANDGLALWRRSTRWPQASRSLRHWKTSRVVPSAPRAGGAPRPRTRWTTDPASAALAPGSRPRWCSSPPDLQGRADLPLAPDEATKLFDDAAALLAPAAGARAPYRRGRARHLAPKRGREAGAAPRGAPSCRWRRGRGAGRPEARAPLTAGPHVAAGDPAAWPLPAGLSLAPAAVRGQTGSNRSTKRVRTLRLPGGVSHPADKIYADKLKAALDGATGRKWMLAFEVGSPAEASLAAQKSREQAEQKSRTEAAFRDEPFVQDVLARFDAKIRPDSIKPLS
jgi:DNA polymerase-3 subunit gamma/tau